MNMAQLYRKSAVERISTPEQLDKALTVTSPMSWIALAAVTVVILAAVIWSVTATIPVTVTAAGIVVSPVSTNAVYCPETGTVLNVFVSPNTEVSIGDPLASYRTVSGDVKTVCSDQVGTVTEILVDRRDADGKDAGAGRINQGEALLRLSPKVNSPQVIVCYVGLADAKRIKRGMQVNVSPEIRESHSAGHMAARVVNVDSYAASAEGMDAVLGSDNNVASFFRKDNRAVVAVTCELCPDPNTVSGYSWSNDRGARFEVTNGTPVEAKIIVAEVRPITRLSAKLKDIWGD